MVGRILQRNYVRKWLIRYHNGWKAAGIYDAIKAESSELQSLDPFEDISPLVTEHDESESSLLATIDKLMVAGEFCERTLSCGRIL